MIHLVVCLLVTILLKLKIIKTRTLILPVVFLVPVCGVLLLIAEIYVDKRKKSGTKDIDVDKLKIKEARFKQIEISREHEAENVVPLEEAMVMNDARTRRKLMLDILHKNPVEHIDLLQRARLMGDTELTHYATTTMMEIQSSYERAIREYEEILEDLEEKRERIRILRKLRRELDAYIESGLVTGNVLQIYRRKLGDVLESLVEYVPENKKYYLEKIKNEIDLSVYDDVEEKLEIAMRRWPADEQVYRVLVRYYQATHQGEAIQRTIKEIEDEKVYLSRDGKQWLDFWKNKELA